MYTTKDGEQLDPAGPLSDYERYLLEKFFSDPNQFPQQFKAWLLDHVTVNGRQEPNQGVYSGQPLFTKRLESAASSVTFEVPTNYTHLRLVGSADNDTGAAGIAVRFNGDTGNNYQWVEQGWHNGTGRTDSQSGDTSSARVGLCYNQNDSFPFDAIIVDYRSSHSKRLISNYAAYDAGGANFTIRQSGGFWASGNAITSITVMLSAAGNFDAGSAFSLYGLL